VPHPANKKWTFFTIALLLAICGGCFMWLGAGWSDDRKTMPAPARVDSFADYITPTLKTSWGFYKRRFLIDGSHVASNNYGGTITEGQSYALLKSVWMNDPDTFQAVWRWTRESMRRPGDYLFGWRWGTLPNGETGLLETENASDADQDIAYALLLAGEKWHQPAYTQAAKHIIADLWRLNVIESDRHYYLLPGTWKGFRDEYISIDPSYLAPYVYRRFALADPTHQAGWTQLANDVYETLEACSNLTARQLPPNWCGVNYADLKHPKSISESIRFSDRQGPGSRHFGYDAFRVFWRMSMDARLSPPAEAIRAKQYLQTHSALFTYWTHHQAMPEGFTEDGDPIPVTSPGYSFSGFTAGPLLVSQAYQPGPQNAGLVLVYRQTLGTAYHPDGYWFNNHNDFLHSVIWFHLYALSLK